MESLFRIVLQMSITAGYVILVVMVLRLLMHRMPKKYSYSLWAVVLFRLCCPITLSSVFSVFNLSARKGDDVIIDLSGVPYVPSYTTENADIPIDLGAPAATEAVNDVIMETIPDQDVIAPVTASPSQPAVENVVEQANNIDLMSLLSMIWIIGMAALAIYALIRYIRLRKSLEFSTPLYSNIRQADIKSPFLMGLIKPVIYMPFNIDKTSFEMSLAHERHHIERKDHWIRTLSFCVLCVHWMNPLCWIAYFLMIRDMEMSCDEYVLSMKGDHRAAYSYALLSFAASERSYLVAPVTFGGASVRDRIKNAMHFKRRGKLTSVIAALLCVLTLASCAFNGKVPESLDPAVPDNQEAGNETESEEFEPIRQIGKPIGDIIGSPAKTAHGYYEISRWNNPDYSNIVYTDYASQQTIFLCNVPGCAHNTPDCTSYVAGGQNTVLFTDYSEEHLYMIFPGREASDWAEAAPATLTEMNMDGSGRRVVCTLPTEEHFSINYVCIAGDEYVFVLVERTEIGKVKQWDFQTSELIEVDALITRTAVEKIWLSDGKREKIRDLEREIDAYEELAGVEEDKYLLFKKWEEGEESRYYEILVDQNGETVEIREPSTPYGYTYVGSTRLKLETDGEVATATAVFSDSGEEKTIKDIPYTTDNPATLYGGYENKILMQYRWTETENAEEVNGKLIGGTDRSRAFVLDFSDGTWKEFDLRQKTNSHYFVTPLAESGDDYLVLIDRKDTKINLVDAQGVPRAYDYYGRDTYALMTKEDFWNSVPNYREIEDKLG